MIQLVAFDLDGTIGDTIPMCIKAFKKAVEPYAMRKLSEDEIIQTFGLNEEGMIKQVVGRNWEKALGNFYTHYTCMHEMCPYPFDGIIELIQELRSKSIKVALVTGKGNSSCSITLDKFKMKDCFDRIETGSPYENRKPEAICNLLREYNLQHNEALYIGDTVSDVLVCKQIGIECLSAAWAKNVRFEQLEEVNTGNVIKSVSELKEQLNLKIY